MTGQARKRKDKVLDHSDLLRKQERRNAGIGLVQTHPSVPYGCSHAFPSACILHATVYPEACQHRYSMCRAFLIHMDHPCRFSKTLCWILLLCTDSVEPGTEVTQRHRSAAQRSALETLRVPSPLQVLAVERTRTRFTRPARTVTRT